MLPALVEPDERGDSASPLRWTTKSTRKLAGEFTRQGHRVSADTVASILGGERFSLWANAKTPEGGRHPNRDAQFRYLNEQVRTHRDAGQPLLNPYKIIQGTVKALDGNFQVIVMKHADLDDEPLRSSGEARWRHSNGRALVPQNWIAEDINGV